jgi:uncharacterized membrane protein HdeD (DUF308 family)
MAAYESDVVPTEGPNPWPVVVIIGVLTLVVGIWLMFSPNAAVFTLALLLAIGLFLNGIADLVFARDRHNPTVGYVIGALYVIGGIVVIAWPDIGLTALAVLVGITLMVVGLVQVATALMDREDIHHWIWLAILGGVTFLAGVFAVFWPDVTVFVLAFILGLRLTVYGLMLLVVGFTMRKLTHP